jgi:hypothetical protein
MLTRLLTGLLEAPLRAVYAAVGTAAALAALERFYTSGLSVVACEM